VGQVRRVASTELDVASGRGAPKLLDAFVEQSIVQNYAEQ